MIWRGVSVPSNKEESHWKSEDLCIPIYLNQQIVFDQLAILQDGFSSVQEIRTSTLEADSQQTGLSGSITAGILNLVGVTFGAGRSKTTGSTQQHETSTQKVHTPASLFAQLRKALNDNALLYQVRALSDLDNLESGQFVEFKAMLRKNPIVETLEWLKNAYELASLLTGTDGQQQGHKDKNRQKQSVDPLTQQLDAMLKGVSQENSMEVIGDIQGIDGARAVLSAQTAYFNDRNATEIVDGEFYVIGKTVRVLKSTSDSDDSINLLRKTTFGRLDESIFQSLATAIRQGELKQFELPPFEKELHGPAIQVMPIAIFT